MSRIVKRLRRKTHTIKVYEDPEMEKGFWSLIWDKHNLCLYSSNYQYTMEDALEVAKENAPLV